MLGRRRDVHKVKVTRKACYDAYLLNFSQEILMTQRKHIKAAAAMPILDPEHGRHYRAIGEHEIGQARAEGCCLHHEFEEKEECTADYAEVYWVVLVDRWYAATPEWVGEYHRAGGSWEYNS